jgi:putative transposase
MALNEYLIHYHQERNHQGKENRLLFPPQDYQPQKRNGKIKCRSRLGGKLKYYYREAA